MIRNILIPGMSEIPYAHMAIAENHAGKIQGRGLKLSDIVFLTSRIVMTVIDYPSGTSAWAFYPKTGCEEFISSKGENESQNDFTDRCIDRILKDHNWHNEDVEKLINFREGKE